AAASSLDERVVDQLRALDTPGSGFFEGVVALFLDTTPGRLDALEAAVAKSDVPSARALAHALRSPCGNVGARRMHDLWAELEQRATEEAGTLGARVRAPAAESLQVRQAREAEQRPARPTAPRPGS